MTILKPIKADVGKAINKINSENGNQGMIALY